MTENLAAAEDLHPDTVYRPFGPDARFSGNTIDGFQDPLPPAHTGPAYHYTSAEGIYGMITEGCVYAAHAVTLNDPLEGGYGWQRIRERYESHPPRGADEFGGVFGEIFASAGDWSWETSPFVLSGTSLAGDLNQYRLYGMYEVELAGGTWGLLVNQGVRHPWPTPYAQWRPVLYGIRQAEPYIDRMLAWAVAIMASVPPEEFEDTGLVAGWAIQVLALHIKHEAYAHERELRLLFGVSRGGWEDWVGVRPRGGRLVPFVRAASGPDHRRDGFIRAVELGPTVQGQANLDAVRHLHQMRYPASTFAVGFDGIPVTESTTQYRDR